MSYAWSEWLNLVLRWLHVVAAIFWIGQTALFSWLDRRLHLEADADGRQRIWMVHSGGFYVVDKQVTPELLPRTLHWFKWEATITWLSGFALLVLVYYMGGVLVEPGSGVSQAEGIALGLTTLAVGWLAYDLLWVSPLGRRQRLATLLSFGLLAAAAFATRQFLTGRAAYLHVGALMGTVMAANVWMRILPAQRQMIAATQAGRPADMTLGERAKQRSQHNTFMAIPVVFIMISSHFPTASYGHRLDWMMLLVFIAVGFASRAVLNRAESR